MGRSKRNITLLVVLPAICFSFASDTPTQPPATSAHSLYEQRPNWVRKPAAPFDEIDDQAERQAFRSLLQAPDPAERLRLAAEFLKAYPQSWVLAQVYAAAAQGAMAQGLYDRALPYAASSLKMLPEDPLLLVPAADLEARRGLLELAMQSSRQALDELDRFLPPASIPEEKWPELKKQLRASCYFALGRAQVTQALAATASPSRDKLLRQAVEDLARARDLNSQNAEIPYLAGLAYLSLNDAQSAASLFAVAYRLGGPLQPKAFQQLKKLHDLSATAAAISLEKYVDTLPAPKPDESLPGPVPASEPLPGYAGSAACRQCHPDVYEQWSHTGMAKMFRPYSPENVIGDFTSHNKYYDDDTDQGKNGPAPATPDHEQKLFARMIVDGGRHYFEIRQSGQWHRYPVDYTIGSKWEQAYATKLPNGEIHVFPVQYNLIEKRWLNFWKTLDAPGGARADLRQWEKLDLATSYQANCAVCHTSQLRNVKNGGIEPNGLEFREAGIDCEMCHGPSSRHVASMRAGEAYEKPPIDPPVDFSRISAPEFMAICAQCHEQSAVRKAGSQGELNYSSEGQFYQHYAQRPYGEFTRKAFYKDGRFRGTSFIVESLMRSECFKKGKVTCGSCHDPHAADSATNPTSLKFRDNPDQMCVQCHAQFGNKEAAQRHTHHAPTSDSRHCVSCHMPRIMDALLFEARSHQISEIPDADMTQRFGAQESPNACLLCHQEENAGWVKSQLTSWNTESAKSSGR